MQSISGKRASRQRKKGLFRALFLLFILISLLLTSCRSQGPISTWISIEAPWRWTYSTYPGLAFEIAWPSEIYPYEPIYLDVTTTGNSGIFVYDQALIQMLAQKEWEEATARGEDIPLEAFLNDRRHFDLDGFVPGRDGSSMVPLFPASQSVSQNNPAIICWINVDRTRYNAGEIVGSEEEGGALLKIHVRSSVRGPVGYALVETYYSESSVPGIEPYWYARVLEAHIYTTQEMQKEYDERIEIAEKVFERYEKRLGYSVEP